MFVDTLQRESVSKKIGREEKWEALDDWREKIIKCEEKG